MVLNLNDEEKEQKTYIERIPNVITTENNANVNQNVINLLTKILIKGEENSVTI